MRLEALWHDLECGAYEEDLPLWRALAGEAGGPVLDVGAGTGRVSLDLAAGGVPVVGLDTEPELLEVLRHRAAGLPVETVVADARDFTLARRFALVLVPMQTLQLLGGRSGRAAFLRCALDHLEPGGLVAAALADAMDCFDDERDAPPPPDAREIADVRYASQLSRSSTRADARRSTGGARSPGPRSAANRPRTIVRLDRVTAEEVGGGGRRTGLRDRALSGPSPRPRSTSARRWSSSARRADRPQVRIARSSSPKMRIPWTM